jgi:hypothetical protein
VRPSSCRRRCAGGDRPAHRRAAKRSDLRRGAGRVELHLCASDLDAVRNYLDIVDQGVVSRRRAPLKVIGTNPTETCRAKGNVHDTSRCIRDKAARCEESPNRRFPRSRRCIIEAALASRANVQSGLQWRFSLSNRRWLRRLRFKRYFTERNTRRRKRHSSVVRAAGKGTILNDTTGERARQPKDRPSSGR